MTLRELIDHVSDFDSESPALDYELQIQNVDGMNQNVFIPDVEINEEAKIINIKFARTRRKDLK